MTADASSESSNTDRPLPSDSQRFRIVVVGHFDQAAELGEILASTADVPRDDAMSAARRAPGILSLRLSRQVADTLSQQIGARGIRAFTISESTIPRLEHVELIHHVRLSNDGLQLLGIHGELRRLVRWSDVSLLSAGCFPLEDAHRLSAEPQVVIHAAPNPHRAIAETARRASLVLWLVCESPAQVYRLVHNQINYEYLGPRKSDSSSRNFGLFVEDLARRAPHACLTPATRALIHHGLRRHFEFHSADELRDFTALHVLVHKQRTLDSAGRPSSREDSPPAM